MEEGNEKCLFDPEEALDCWGDTMQLIHGTEAENRIGGSNKEGNFPVLKSVQITNPLEDNMDIICCIGIKIDDENDTAPDNAHEQKEQHQGNG